MKHLTIYILFTVLSHAAIAQKAGDIITTICSEYGCRDEYQGNILDDADAHEDTTPRTECYGFDCQTEQTFIEGGDLWE